MFRNVSMILLAFPSSEDANISIIYLYCVYAYFLIQCCERSRMVWGLNTLHPLTTMRTVIQGLLSSLHCPWEKQLFQKLWLIFWQSIYPMHAILLSLDQSNQFYFIFFALNLFLHIKTAPQGIPSAEYFTFHTCLSADSYLPQDIFSLIYRVKCKFKFV